ncbi:cysteine proteinase [Parathielavia appendiculata]|uniref:Cysteine proteinase n=1 Tax=Parathielavia appendiculata TaxID=2587402 RepID=A0AAN6U0D6_9PEZI|nr:cysteine proteinase [Parathielavia appendiculata]
MEAQALEHERRLAQTQGEDALRHAIAAAELYMQAAGKAKTAEDRKRLRKKCVELIGLGERLKATAKGTDAASRPPAPKSTRPLTTAEKTILLKASRLHGHVFPPWESAPGSESFSTAGGPGEQYVDSSPFSLSEEQQSIFAGWRRPSELTGVKDGGPGTMDQLMTAQADMDLAQDLATDCSVVASLCAAARHLGPTKDSLLGSLMYPFDRTTNRPEVSKNGKYIFRMYFNGSWRHVVIDDRLPASHTDRTLYVVDRRNPRLIWPALVEKAYLKIRGGYDFPGSNSGTDLLALTGWIPEQIFLQSDEIELDETWNRIKKAYDEGNAMLTLGTGNILPEEEKASGLVREHDYAVISLKKEDGSRLLLIKNPWVDSLVWTGVGSSATLKAHTVGSGSEGASNQFWMAFEDVLQHFESLYVNWNPALFPYRQDHHFKWDMPDKTEELVFTRNPQYSVLSPSGNPVWVLLSRHWQDGELDILRQRKAEREGGQASLATVSKQLGFMALAIYASSPPGTRVPLPDTSRRLHQTPFVDSPNTLLRYNSTAGTPQTLVITQTELPFPTYSFTLSFFSYQPLTIAPAAHPLSHNTSLTGAWTRRTAGGSASHPSYFTNPQYLLALSAPSPLSLVLSTDARDLPLHVAVLFSPSLTASTTTSTANITNQRITSLSGRDILCASSEYHRGCTSASHPLLGAGSYTLILSTFEPGHLARYTLTLSTSTSHSITPLPSDGAGRLRTPVPPTNPATPVNFPGGTSRLRAQLSVARLTRLNAVTRTAADATTTTSRAPSGAAAMRVSLELGTGAHRTVLAMSRDGEFADAAMGLRTGEVDVEPEVVRARGGLWIVLERIGGGGVGYTSGGGGVAGGVQVEVLSDGEVQAGGWENGDED